MERLLELIKQLPEPKRSLYLKQLRNLIARKKSKQLIQLVNTLITHKTGIERQAMLGGIKLVKEDVDKVVKDETRRLAVVQREIEEELTGIAKDTKGSLKEVESKVKRTKATLSKKIAKEQLKNKKNIETTRKHIDVLDTKLTRKLDSALVTLFRKADKLKDKPQKKIELVAGENIEITKKELKTKIKYTISAEEALAKISVMNSPGGGGGGGGTWGSITGTLSNQTDLQTALDAKIDDTNEVIKDSHIDWGTGADQVSIEDIPSGLTQGGVLFAGAGGYVTEDSGNLYYVSTGGGMLAVGDNSGMRNTFQAVRGDDTIDPEHAKGISSVRNTSATNNNWSIFSLQATDTDGAIKSGARMMAHFTSHAIGGVTADLVFDTRNAGTRSEKMRLSAAGNLTITGTVDGVDVGTDVPLNTTHRSSDGSDHADVVTNTAGIATNVTAIALNTTHCSSDGTDHTYIDQDLQTTASPTHANVYVPNGGFMGISGADGWTFDSSNGDITTMSDVGIGTAEPNLPLNVQYGFAKTDITERGIAAFKSNEAFASNPQTLTITSIGAAVIGDRTFALQTGESGVAYGGNLVFQPYGGNVGIGTTIPDQTLTVNGSARIHYDGYASLFFSAHGTNAAGTFIGERSRGTKASPTAILDDDVIFAMQGRGYDGAGYDYTTNHIIVGASENFTSTNQGSHVRFCTVSNGTTSGVERMRISHDGNVGIGTTGPAAMLDIYKIVATLQGGPTIRLTRDYTNNDYGSAIYSGWVGGKEYLVFGVSSNANPAVAGQERMVISHDGNVGIGTTSPSGIFHVNQNANVGTNVYMQNANAGSSARIGLALFSDAVDLRMLAYSAAHSARPRVGCIGTVSNSNLRIITNNTDRVTILAANGNVGIGTTIPSYRLQLSTNSAAKPTSSAWTIASDRRVKKDITDFTDGLDVINQINPIRYTYNGKADLPENEGIGIIAQDIQKIAPYTVNTYQARFNKDDEEDTELLNFDSHALTFVTINAIQELSTLGDARDVRIKELEAEVAELRKVEKPVGK